jgi:hypothetical protein
MPPLQPPPLAPSARDLPATDRHGLAGWQAQQGMITGLERHARCGVAWGYRAEFLAHGTHYRPPSTFELPASLLRHRVTRICSVAGLLLGMSPACIWWNCIEQIIMMCMSFTLFLWVNSLCRFGPSFGLHWLFNDVKFVVNSQNCIWVTFLYAISFRNQLKEASNQIWCR